MNAKLGIAVVLVVATAVSTVGLIIYFYNQTLPSAPVSEVSPEIIYSSSYVEEVSSAVRFFVVFGLIQNDFESPIGSVRINATFYDAENRSVGSNFGGTALKVIKSGQKAPFEVYFPLGSGDVPAKYVLLSSSVTTDEEPIVGVEIMNFTHSFDEDEFNVIDGYVKNMGVMNALNVKVYGVYHNSEGRVVSLSEGFVSPSINPGVTMPFELSSKPYKVDFASCEVLVVARKYEWFFFWRYGSPQLWLLCVLIGAFVLFIVYAKRRGW